MNMEDTNKEEEWAKVIISSMKSLVSSIPNDLILGRTYRKNRKGSMLERSIPNDWKLGRELRKLYGIR